ncbi:MAG: lipid-A-disaccharide synthase [Rubrivivax sp.]|nr:MAG: lipid-A-disaccharide synthase [Rubrivivax sp.]
MVAGEASGDLLAGLLLGGLTQRWPGLQSMGIGGPRMAAQGFDAWWPHHKLAVRGYVEVLRHYREIVGIRRQLAERLLADRPSLFIGVDAPDFNLGLEATLKSAGIKSVHFVSPSIWAWRGKRIEKIHESVAVLPGSRRSEVAYIAPSFLRTVALLSRQRPGLRFVLPVVPGLRAMVEPMVAEHCPDALLTLLDGRSHEALAACDATLIASGTATLEAALFKQPMVIAYRMNGLSWQMMKRMRYQPWVGLPNILAQDFVVPERLQDDANPEQLARDVLDWLDHPAKAEAARQRFIELHHLLRRDTARCASDAIAQVLDQA